MQRLPCLCGRREQRTGLPPFRPFFPPQNGGGLLCAVDDSNDHVLSVWDWQKEQKLADVKVSLCGREACPLSATAHHVLAAAATPKARQSPLPALQCSNESVLAATFHPTEPTLLITCGKSHIHFWTLEGGSLSKRQGIFEVRVRGGGEGAARGQVHSTETLLHTAASLSARAVRPGLSSHIHHHTPLWGKNRKEMEICWKPFR